MCTSEVVINVVVSGMSVEVVIYIITNNCNFTRKWSLHIIILPNMEAITGKK